jgi:hypothetical protein
VDFGQLLARRVEPPFAPKTFVADVASSDAIEWSAVTPDPLNKTQRMDIAPRRFDEIFAKFEYRSPE